MGFTPNIVFEWGDLKPEHFTDIGAMKYGDRYSVAFAEQMKDAPNEIAEFKGHRLVYLVPVTTSQTEAFRERLDEWGIEYCLIGA